MGSNCSTALRMGAPGTTDLHMNVSFTTRDVKLDVACEQECQRRLGLLRHGVWLKVTSTRLAAPLTFVVHERDDLEIFAWQSTMDSEGACDGESISPLGSADGGATNLTLPVVDVGSDIFLLVGSTHGRDSDPTDIIHDPPIRLSGAYALPPSRFREASRQQGLPASHMCEAAGAQVEALRPLVERIISTTPEAEVQRAHEDGQQRDRGARHLVFHNRSAKTAVVQMDLPDEMRRRVLADAARLQRMEKLLYERVRQSRHFAGYGPWTLQFENAVFFMADCVEFLERNRERVVYAARSSNRRHARRSMLAFIAQTRRPSPCRNSAPSSRRLSTATATSSAPTARTGRTACTTRARTALRPSRAPRPPSPPRRT